MITGSGEMLSR